MATSTRALFISLVAVVAAFVASTVLAQASARRIDADALFISRDAAPGIESVSQLRTALRDYEFGVLREFSPTPGVPKDVEEPRQRIAALLERAMALPNDPTETALFITLRDALRSLDVAVAQAIAQHRAGQDTLARGTVRDQVRPLTDRAVAATQRLIDHNAEEIGRAALRIEEKRAQANRTAFELDGLSVALAMAAGFLAWRTLRKVRRVQQENHLLAQRRAEELEQFAGRVAHDILSPLSAVSIGIGIANRTQPSEALQRSRGALDRVGQIVSGLLEFARAGAQPEPGARVEVRPVVDALADELSHFAKEHAAELSLGPAPDCAVSCSEGVLLSLLGNLLRNALKYLGAAQVRQVSLRVSRRRGRVLFEVEDTGPGVPAGLQARIFEPYVRGKHDGIAGIGLGLATVRRLVTSHGGDVGLKAAPGGGALFWFDLPEAEPLHARAADSRVASDLDQPASTL